MRKNPADYPPLVLIATKGLLALARLGFNFTATDPRKINPFERHAMNAALDEIYDSHHNEWRALVYYIGPEERAKRVEEAKQRLVEARELRAECRAVGRMEILLEETRHAKDRSRFSREFSREDLARLDSEFFRVNPAAFRYMSPVEISRR